jgi:hypothetical protein
VFLCCRQILPLFFFSSRLHGWLPCRNGPRFIENCNFLKRQTCLKIYLQTRFYIDIYIHIYIHTVYALNWRNNNSLKILSSVAKTKMGQNLYQPTSIGILVWCWGIGHYFLILKIHHLGFCKKYFTAARVQIIVNVIQNWWSAENGV